MIPPIATLAHAFGETYVLPLPLWLFLFAAGAAVLLSFVLVSLLVDTEPPVSAEQVRAKPLRWLTPAGKAIGLFLLWLTIFSGWFSTLPYGFSAVFFWAVFLLGFTYLVAIFGNLWEVVNPFRTLAECLEYVFDTKFSGRIKLSAKLSHFPAFLFYFGLVWFELTSASNGASPGIIAQALTAYTVLTLFCAYVFGKDSWLKNGEIFTVFFGLVSKLSPIRIYRGTYSFRKPLAGLLEPEPVGFWLLLFIIFMLASTGFDGLLATEKFADFSYWLPETLTKSIDIYIGACLLIAPFLLLGIYLLFIWLVKACARTAQPTFLLAYRFAFSLIPIAIAYNAAHYMSLLFNQLITFNKFAFDPLDMGWNLFGLAHPNLNVNQMNVTFVWYAQVTLIIAGHAAAVYIAHKIALREFPDRKQAVRSQYPLIALMVLYTVGSLLIIGMPLSVGK